MSRADPAATGFLRARRVLAVVSSEDANEPYAALPRTCSRIAVAILESLQVR